ncbi:MAG TPA: response regulator transcription factor [Dinghuibacter sp.]|uniref:response regulator transcription factor n=1 Tax=Dinghuibacter sp. TaxID=2024697 RepID=UPI002B7BC4B9|nr:response regulator transcription factor [Dinghuibacter sp.]HTJ12751.1 response regulator transcription factor [Dinghuibacter sp.]
MHILLVEDEPKVADFIRKGLKEKAYSVELVSDGTLGEERALREVFDLVILDVILPGKSGLEVCKTVRREKPDLPIIMLTALGTTQDKVTGFESGADDYLVKPFHFDELLARIKALSRRRTVAAPGTIRKVADLEIDIYQKKAWRAGKEILLTAKEFALLDLLVQNKDSVLSRSSIAEAVWGIDFNRRTNLIDVYINYLREKIDKGFGKPLIHTVIGMGYVLKEKP